MLNHVLHVYMAHLDKHQTTINTSPYQANLDLRPSTV